MGIINGLDNQRGIQTLGTVIANASTLAQHASDILYHTNGYLYCVVSEDYANATLERRLYMYRSIDGGSAWTKISNLTSGRFDTLPCLIQLDETDDNSDIGIVFIAATTSQASSGTIRRMAVDVDGTETLPADAITGSPSSQTFVSVVKSASGYKLFYSNGGFTRSVICYSNNSFNLNSWTNESNQNVLGVNQEGRLNRVRRLSNGDYLAVFSARSGLNGTANGSNNVPDNARTDLVAVTSTDEGVSWNSPQSITTYAGTAGVSKNGIDSVGYGDVIERNDGRLAFLFAEIKSQVMIDGDTTPSLSPTDGFIGYRKTLYHPVHDYLIYAHDGNGGVYVHNLATNVITRLHTGSTPAIWRNEVVDMDISADGTYLVCGTASQGFAADDGSLEIFDTTDPDPTLWTVTSLRTSTTPALAFERVGQIKFLSSGSEFIFTYGNSSGTTVGGRVDAASPTTITAFISPVSSGSQRGLAINEADNRAYGLSSNTVFAINLTTGAAGHSSTISGFTGTASYLYPLQYFPDTGELILFGDNTIRRLDDNGSSFTVIGSAITTSTNPASFNFSTWRPLSGSNILASGGNNVPIGVYCTNEDAWYPGVMQVLDLNLGWNTNLGQIHFDEVTLSGKNWLVGPGLVSIPRVALNTGRLRVGTFTYNTGTSQVDTGSADFYDAVNEVRVGTDWDRLQYPRIHRDAEDRIHVSATRLNLNRTTQPKKVITGVIESDAQRFTMRGTILKLTTRELEMRARIRNTYTNELDMRARIVFAQCIKMQARIVPRSTYTLQMQATIQNTKSNSMTGTFNVEYTQQVRMEGRFFVATGYNGSQSVQIGASIVKRRINRMTGHFLVKQANTPKIASYVVGFDQITVQTLKIGAGIIQQ